MPRFAWYYPPLLLLTFCWPALAQPPRVEASPSQRAFLREHCQECHRADKQKGNFRVDNLPISIGDLPTAERWQKVLNVLNAGEMPPEEARQPQKAAKSDFLEQLSNLMVSARKSLSDEKGYITLRRLNQREYFNTLRDLLGVRTNVSELPSDTGAGFFDTVGVNLFMSSNQFEQYRGLARDALDEAFARRKNAALELRHRVEVEERSSHPYQRTVRWLDAFKKAAEQPENAQIVADLRKGTRNESEFRKAWSKIPGAPDPADFGFDPKSDFADVIRRLVGEGKMNEHVLQYVGLPAIEHGAYLCNFGVVNPSLIFSASFETPADRLKFPVGAAPAGEYILRVRVAASDTAPAARRFIEFGTGAGDQASVISTHEVTGTPQSPQIMEIPFSLPQMTAATAGGEAQRSSRTLFIRERGVRDLNYGYQITLKQRATGKMEPTFAIWVDWMELERVKTEGLPLPPGLDALGILLEDEAAAPHESDLRGALDAFCLEAFRGTPASEPYLDRLTGLYALRRKSGDKHAEALKYVLSVVLSSPSFLYLEEPMPDSKRRKLSGPELAVRLSYFLWGAPPDSTLRAAGRNGTLSRPDVLLAETDRLLQDPRSQDFVKAFVHQWWGLDRLDFFQPDRAVFPEFDSNTKRAARQEVYETFAHLLRHGGSARELLKSDSVVVNGLLARYYGLSGIHGDAFRKVSLPADSPRGGVLGMAAFCYMGSNGQRTSPVERGAWVLRKLLNDPLPPAPANVPSLSRLENQPLTARQRIQAHREEPQCAHCHRKIDPIGFGLENFDPTGQWRTEDTVEAATNKPQVPGRRKTAPVDPSAAFHKGPAFKDYFELRDLIHQRSDDFARGLASALVEFGLGRPCGFSDAPLLDAILKRAQGGNLALREFINALVTSEDFQSK